MPLLSRIRNVFRKDTLQLEIDEELADHIDEAIRAGRSREDAERALGGLLRYREASTDIKLAAWLDSLKADIIFGLRQLKRRPTITAAAILSLALAIGAVTAAFRLTDAVLLRPLPVADPQSLFVLGYTVIDRETGKADEGNSFSYPQFREFRDAVKDRADLMVVGYTGRNDITYGSDNEMEKANRQFVSGNHFSVFGLNAATGRLLTASDDQTPDAHPVAVLSYDYWTRRFGRDPKAVGRTFRLGTGLYEIIGVAQEGYTGTEPGTMTDIFVPAMQNAEVIQNSNWSWMRIWARLKPGVSESQLQQPLQASMSAHRRERTKRWPADTPKARLDQFVNAALSLHSAAAGASSTQRNFRQPLLILGAVVLLVLFIACANVANLLTAQTAAREKEMALRVSIGAGRSRLVQLMLVECLMLAIAATAIGALFAWWSAPFVVSMINPPDNPVRLHLPADWRVLSFAAALALGVTILFGLGPALRASTVKPLQALKGGENPHSRRRLMHALIAAQVAFCFLVHFAAGLFVATFQRLASQPTGFTVERILLLETNVKGGGDAARRPQNAWTEIADGIRSTPGVESASFAAFALMGRSAWTMGVHFPNREPDSIAPYFLAVSPGWLESMGIDLLAGRDFRPGERPSTIDKEKKPVEGAVIVNEAFARRYFDGEVPVGRSFEVLERDNIPVGNPIVGYVRDARYRDLREPMRPTVYVPFHEGGSGTFVVRTAAADASVLAGRLRRLVSEVRPEFRVSNVQTQAELVRGHTVRERLLATLSLFFAIVALMLAAVGLYGVLHHAVTQRRREIGIRMALGARTGHIARHVGGDLLLMMILGSGIGLAAGLASERFVESLLFEVKGTDLRVLVTPLLTLFAAAVLAALPPMLAAARTDPATALRSE